MMTNREFYNAVINAEVSEELKSFAQNAIEKMDARNEKRSSKPSKVAIANAPLKEQILTLVNDKSLTTAEVAKALEVSTQKASALLRQMCVDGTLTSFEVKVPKKGKVKAYALAEGAQYLIREIAE